MWRAIWWYLDDPLPQQKVVQQADENIKGERRETPGYITLINRPDMLVKMGKNGDVMWIAVKEAPHGSGK